MCCLAAGLLWKRLLVRALPPPPSRTAGVMLDCLLALFGTLASTPGCAKEGLVAEQDLHPLQVRLGS